MPDHSGANGHWEKFSERQEQRFDSLEVILKNGFDHSQQALGEIRDEIKNLQKGLIEALLSQDRIPMKMAERNQDNMQKVYLRVIYTLCTVFTAIVIWITGLKYLNPDINI